ncbi:hypothetical protein [Photobacterium indicum]
MLGKKLLSIEQYLAQRARSCPKQYHIMGWDSTGQRLMFMVLTLKNVGK